jgi:hypothetical protein
MIFLHFRETRNDKSLSHTLALVMNTGLLILTVHHQWYRPLDDQQAHRMQLWGTRRTIQIVSLRTAD